MRLGLWLSCIVRANKKPDPWGSGADAYQLVSAAKA